MIRKLERYYTIIRKAYNCITIKILGLNRDIALQMSFKAANDLISLNSLIDIDRKGTPRPLILRVLVLSPSLAINL